MSVRPEAVPTAGAIWPVAQRTMPAPSRHRGGAKRNSGGRPGSPGAAAGAGRPGRFSLLHNAEAAASDAVDEELAEISAGVPISPIGLHAAQPPLGDETSSVTAAAADAATDGNSGAGSVRDIGAGSARADISPAGTTGSAAGARTGSGGRGAKDGNPPGGSVGSGGVQRWGARVRAVSEGGSEGAKGVRSHLSPRGAAVTEKGEPAAMSSSGVLNVIPEVRFEGGRQTSPPQGSNLRPRTLPAPEVSSGKPLGNLALGCQTHTSE